MRGVALVSPVSSSGAPSMRSSVFWRTRAISAFDQSRIARDVLVGALAQLGRLGGPGARGSPRPGRWPRPQAGRRLLAARERGLAHGLDQAGDERVVAARGALGARHLGSRRVQPAFGAVLLGTSSAVPAPVDSSAGLPAAHRRSGRSPRSRSGGGLGRRSSRPRQWSRARRAHPARRPLTCLASRPRRNGRDPRRARRPRPSLDRAGVVARRNRPRASPPRHPRRAALGRPREAEAAFLLARHRSSIPRGVVARLIPVPDVWDRRGAVAFWGSDRWYRSGPGGTGCRERRGRDAEPRFTLVPCSIRRRPSTASPARLDRRGRALRDLRISVTDRCNFRCPYCMPGEVFGRDYQFLPRDEILTLRGDPPAGRVFVGLGRAQAPDHGRRADGPARPARPGRDARRAAHARRRAGRPGDDDQRLGAPAPRPAARRRRACGA